MELLNYNSRITLFNGIKILIINMNAVNKNATERLTHRVIRRTRDRTGPPPSFISMGLLSGALKPPEAAWAPPLVLNFHRV